jgi:hypothetical protein
MQQHLITDVYLLAFLLLVGWAVARSLWKWKRTSPEARAPLFRKTAARKMLRLAVTGLVAFAIVLALFKDADYAWLVWLVLWVALYGPPAFGGHEIKKLGKWTGFLYSYS